MSEIRPPYQTEQKPTVKVDLTLAERNLIMRLRNLMNKGRDLVLVELKGEPHCREVGKRER